MNTPETPEVPKVPRRPYAERGTKTKERLLAIHTGRKQFDWFCRRGHGKTKFGVAGTGQCRLCIEEHRKAYRKRITESRIARQSDQ